MNLGKKISLIGAGNIGTILAFSLSRKKLGNITLIDKVKACGGQMFRFVQSLSVENLNTQIIGTEDISQIKDSDAIIITAGIPENLECQEMI